MVDSIIGPKFREKYENRLQNIHVLVADHDSRISNLVRQVLVSFGFRDIQVAYDAQEAVAVIKKSSIDLMITEWPMAPSDDMDMVQFVRQSEESPRRDLPVIILTGRAERPDVMMARDHGVTEFVVKPFTAQTLSHRIVQVIDNPRAFIQTPSFVGPDRRRKSSGDVENDSRMPPEEREKYAKYINGRKVYEIDGKLIEISPANTELQDALGPVTAAILLDETVVKQAQEVIFNMRDEYMEWVAVDINRLEYTCKMLEKRPDDSKQRAALAEIAFSIKAQAGTFGYNLASAVARLLHNYISDLKAIDQMALMVVKKHVDVLLVIFHQEISGGGEQVGEEVLVSLQQLVDKSFRDGT